MQIRIANDTSYGLAGGVWSGDPERAKRVARRMRTGQVEMNGGRFNRVAPLGGLQAIRRTAASSADFGLDEFLESKPCSCQLQGAAAPAGPG